MFAPMAVMTGPGTSWKWPLADSPVAELVAVTVRTTGEPKVGIVEAVQVAPVFHCDGSRPRLAIDADTGAGPNDEVQV
jgi:hypothetical protein